MSVRQQIIDAVKTRLQDITPAAGFAFDLSDGVDEWPGGNISPNRLPCACVSDPADKPLNYLSPDHVDHEMTVEITTIVRSTPAASRALVAEVLRAVGTDPTWGGLAIDTNPTGVEWHVEQREHLFCGALITLTVKYRTQLWSL